MMVAGADMFPVRVLVETVRSQHCLGCAHDGNPMVDTFAVVGGQTMLYQLVETVLSALGLPQLVQDSKGLIQINGWKPIAFETITDNPEELVVNLFREISTHITLKILAKRSSSEPNGQCLAELKQRLLKTAIEKQPQILTTANGQEVKEILQQVIQGDQQCSAWTSREQADAVNEWLEQMAAQQEDGGRKSPLCTTRFSPLSELPRLERWFRSDPNPSRQKLLSYMKILNSLPYRRANNKVTYQQICNWFVNQRRTAQRNGNGGCQGRNEQQQQASSSSGGEAKKPPMAMLPLNATGATGSNQPQPNTTSTNFTLLNSLATALAANGAGTGGGNMDSAQMQQKMATFLAGLGDAEAMLQQQRTTNMLMLDHNSHHNLLHQIPMAVGPPLDIRAKFEVEKEQQQSNDCAASSGQQEGGQRQSGGGQHSDRMDGGSESPTGNDDLSEHSGTSGGPAEGTGDSVACSPDELFMDVTPHQNGVHQNELQDSVARPAEEQQQSDLMNNGAGASSSSLEAATGLSLAQLLQQQQQQPTGNGHQTPSPPSSTHASAMAAAAAAAAAFSSLMPAQTQLQLMNQLAMASQFHHQQQQGISPSTPQPSNNINPFATSNGAAIKSSPSSNSLSAVGRGGEENNVRTKHDSENNYNNSPGGNGGQNSQSRSRLMFDPLSELPILERWFEENPHPGWLQIEQYTDFLNSMTYRQNYPPISTHNVKIWFKNRRAKTKRLLGNNDSNPASNLASS